MTTTTENAKNSKRSATDIDGTRLKQHVIEIAKRFACLATDSREEADRRADRLRPLVERLACGVFRLVVMGEVKKGKSSFISALLGYPDLLPTASDVATSTVYKLLFGPDLKYTVFFLAPENQAVPDSDGPQAAQREPLVISREQLHLYGTESGNPGNREKVDFIAVEVPSPLLREGIVIVDTPGVGGLFRKHRDVTFRYAPNADAVFFVLDSVESVISADEVSFIKELGKVTNQIFFIQTKIDQADETQWQAWRHRNLEVLAGVLGRTAAKVPYFPVSSTIKQDADLHKSGLDLNDSGFLPVIQFLQKALIPRKDGILAVQAARALGGEVAAEGRTVMDRLTIAREGSKEKLAEYKRQLVDAQQEFRNWEAETWRRQVREFQDKVASLRRDVYNQIQDAFSSDAEAFQNMLDAAKASCTDVNQVNSRSEELLNSYASDCAQEGNNLMTEFVSHFKEAYQEAVNAGTGELRALLAAQVTVEAGDFRKDNPGRLDALRMGVMNFTMAGNVTGMASYGVGWAAGTAVAVGLISNPVGWVIAASAGVAALATSIWAAVKGYKNVRERHLAAALGNLERALQQVAQRALRAAHRCLQETSAELDREARDGFDDFVAATKSQFSKRIQEVSEAQTRTGEEAGKAVEILNQRLTALTTMAKDLDMICKSSAAVDASPRS